MNRAQKKKTVSIKDAEIETLLFRNFAGRPDDYNRDGGKRSFTVVLTKEKAEELEEFGLSIRWKEFDDGTEEARLRVTVRYDNFPPKILIGTDPKRMVLMAEDDIYQLDNAELASVDLVISPYWYKENYTAYLQTGYFVIVPNDFSDKFMEVPDEDDLPFNV